MTTARVLVTGATGAQGGAVARALLANGMRVRALVRNASSPGAQALVGAGVELVEGSFDDADSLAAAAGGADAIFSVQLYNPGSASTERIHAQALIEAGLAASVRTFVQTSVSGVDDRNTWRGAQWDDVYWDNKAAVEDMALGAGFAATIVLRPAFMMENFASPKVERMFPELSERRIVSAICEDTPLALVAADDIGSAVAAAIAKPSRFSGGALELAGDVLTLPQVAALLTAASGTPVVAETKSPDAEIARGRSAGWVLSQQWLNEFGYPARPSHMEEIGLQPTPFSRWLQGRQASPMR
ncbi:NmrA family NAD(P)-binding protein [Terricaulis silvestris]|uniref:NAD(P)H azoreductase n=1 Tax=Terricaulis silvestris TaxID=2686094 RepID=A0A6I6MX67_9CAUL|nr:NmrA family NAD(P)-binding protein [Terricaulis silvestris]QGZ96222.1 NAD(P)H azoreductase [Terricaulis silvestris]